MKLYKQDLLTLLISLFIFTGCQNPDSIGLDVDPEDAIEGKLIDTVTVSTATVREEVVNTNSLTKYPMGYLTDPIFGTTDAKIAASLTLGTESLTFGTTPVLDSAVLVLKYADEFTGDANSRMMVEVRQLDDRLTGTTSYSGTTEHPASGAAIGSKSFKVNLKDSVSTIELVKGKADIIKNKAPQLRIPISSSFIQNFFFDVAASNFATNSAFNDLIKGLQIKVNKDQSTGAGGLATFNLSDPDTRLELYYKSQTGAVIDTILTTFNINSGFSAATILHNYAGTDIEAQLNAPSTTYSVNYIQPLGGLRTRINFPYIQNLKSLGDITINKAELILTVENGTDIFAPAPRLFLYRTDIAEQRQLIPDVQLGLSDLSLGGVFEPTKKQYRFSLTAYMQDLLSGKLTQYNTYIAAIDSKASSSTGLSPAGNTVSRTVIGSGNSSLPAKMKLNIIYTKVN